MRVEWHGQSAFTLTGDEAKVFVDPFADMSMLVVVNPKVETKTLREFVALAKAQPGKINFGSPGIGTTGHLGLAMLMVAADILRGRYRESLSAPKAIPPGQKQLYRFALPTANHVFLPGHRIMVQVQSTWFPVYDRNPQTFVDNIFFAKPADYRKATQKLFHSKTEASYIDLPVVGTP